MNGVWRKRVIGLAFRTFGAVLAACCVWTVAPADEIRSDSEAQPDWWAFRPLQLPTLPGVNETSWCRNPIDRFMLSKLESEGLTPAKEAPKRQLIRRLHFDLTGLPPDPTAVEAFLNDRSASAYGTLVDRLLESPHYGERWARHWLDLVRYAESDGFRADHFRPYAWRYRDYVIDAFNTDKPYDRFVLEQLAGDEIAPDDPSVVVATGFLRHGIYEYNQRDARTHWNDIVNEMTDVTADVFLGIGMGCARCHDHKFDPIPKTDYFALQAFFTPMLWTIDEPLATSEEKDTYQVKLAAWERKVQPVLEELRALEAPYRQTAQEAAIIKFPEDVQAMVRKPYAAQSPYERQMYYLVHNQVLFEWDRLDTYIKGDAVKRWADLRKSLKALEAEKPDPLPVGLTVRDASAVAPKTVIPGDRTERDISPAFLTALGGEPATIESVATESTGRRTALAKWIGDPDNPLTTRVVVNRIWQYHFGRGLVRTSSDFGHLGEAPSHPQLLDWLANEFVASGWSFKTMHRLILNSSTYRQSAQRAMPELAQTKDPENRWLWKFHPRRLDAEQIRDAMLAASGESDGRVGGPSVEGIEPRRSVYVKVIRNSPDPLLKAFDTPVGLSSTPQRNETTTATQSLLMINGEWTLQRAKAMASRLKRECGSDSANQIVTAYRLCFARAPTAEEIARAQEFIEDETESTLIDFCHAILNSSEFLYVD